MTERIELEIIDRKTCGIVLTLKNGTVVRGETCKRESMTIGIAEVA
jgi:hypothetical protein